MLRGKASTAISASWFRTASHAFTLSKQTRFMGYTTTGNADVLGLFLKKNPALVGQLVWHEMLVHMLFK
jgi:hypothetical protein